MKRLFFAALAAMSLTLASCEASIESKAESFAERSFEAFKTGDYAKVLEIGQEHEDWLNTLTPEERDRAEQAAEEHIVKLAEKEGIQLPEF